MAQFTPPPAYSEQEFDQKISLVTQLSLDQHQNHAERDDERETWDEVVFENAAMGMQRLSLQGFSGAQETLRTSASVDQHSTIKPVAETRPLQVHLENSLDSSSLAPSSKPRPGWLVEANLDASGASSSRTLSPLAAPAYTSAPSPSATSPLTGPYSSPIVQIPSLSGPSPTQGLLSANLGVAAPLTDESPPPPFPPQRQLPCPCSEISAAHASPAMSDLSIRGSTSGSTPAHSASLDANISLEHKSPTAQQLHVQPQQRLSRLQSSAVLYPEPSLSLYSESSSRSRRPSNPNCLQGYNSNQTASFTPQTMQAPRINVDLSMVYGKRPSVTAIRDFAPSQVLDVSAFYNSSVSAYLGPAHATAAADLIGARRQSSHQPPPTTSLYNFPQETHLVPDRYGPPRAAPVKDVHNQQPYNSALQNPFIRSPTPTYPAGHTTNPMPQILAAADGENYNSAYLPVLPYPAAWTESSNSYR